MNYRQLPGEAMSEQTLERLRSLILLCAAAGQQHVTIHEGTLAFFYEAVVADTLAADGFVLAPPAFVAPAPIDIRWGHCQGVSRLVRPSSLQATNAINAWSMCWLSHATGQRFLAKLTELALRSTEAVEQWPNGTKAVAPVANDEFVALDYTYRLANMEFAAVPVYPEHLIAIVRRLGWSLQMRTLDDVGVTLFI
jgi:hypothetical protein